MTSRDIPIVTIETTTRDEYAPVSLMLAHADANTVPSGILHLSPLRPYEIGEFDGESHVGTCDQARCEQFLLDLQAGAVTDSPQMTIAQAEALQSRTDGITPIVLARVAYQTPKPSYTDRLRATLRSGRDLAPLDTADATTALEDKCAVFASALLRPSARDFGETTYVHHGLHVRFCVPTAGYLTNLTDAAEDLRIDFSDGQGLRTIGFDEVIDISYVDDELKTIAVEFTAGGVPYRAAFSFALVDDRAHSIATGVTSGGGQTGRIPHEGWDVVADQPYAGVTASGRAYVRYGRGNDTGQLRAPLIFADGFGAGKTDFHEFWKLFNVANLAEDILAQGRDIVVLGYDDKSTYIQANAMLMVKTIQDVNSRRFGTEPLIVGGASMGGLVARYALAYMEHHGLAHHARTYISYDTPHNGAWVPLSMQYFAYYFENRSSEAHQSANLMRSRAAQQLLDYWTGAWNHEGTSRNALKVAFREELAALGNWPRIRKVGLANGKGDGIGNYLPSGVVTFEWREDCCGAIPRTQQAGNRQHIAGMWLVTYKNDYYTDNIVPYDGAPGGTSTFFGVAAAGIIAARGQRAMRRNPYPTSCFIPTVSALAVTGDVPLYADLRPLLPHASALDAYKFSEADNTPHVHVTRELADFFLAEVR